jgi:transcriptional regulator with XRE-family HTH domain
MNPSPSGVEIDGERMRELRKLKGLTGIAFAAQVGVTGAYVSQIERGVRPRVSPPVFVKICDALDIRPSDRPSLVVSARRPPAPPRPRRPSSAAAPAVML